MSYGKVYDLFWEDDKIDTLSDKAALLALFLISGPHRNAIGCFRLGIGALTDIGRFSKWGTKGVQSALDELQSIQFIWRDDKSGWTFIRNAMKHDPIKGSKTAIHALALLNRVPKDSVVYRPLIKRLSIQLSEYGEALADKPGYPIEGVSNIDASPIDDEPMAKPSPLPSPLPIPKPNTGTSDKKSDDLGFDEFYKKYPRHEGRGHAEKAYRAAIKLVAKDELLAGLERAVASWAGLEKKFIPLPATWLNGKRWLDELDARPTSKTYSIETDPAYRGVTF